MSNSESTEIIPTPETPKNNNCKTNWLLMVPKTLYFYVLCTECRQKIYENKEIEDFGAEGCRISFTICADCRNKNKMISNLIKNK